MMLSGHATDPTTMPRGCPSPSLGYLTVIGTEWGQTAGLLGYASNQNEATAFGLHCGVTASEQET